MCMCKRVMRLCRRVMRKLVMCKRDMCLCKLACVMPGGTCSGDLVREND